MRRITVQLQLVDSAKERSVCQAKWGRRGALELVEI